MTSSAKIVLDSVGPNGARLTTFELTFPRFILAELNTHRWASKNTASSRAIPVEKLIERIEKDPALPVFWGKVQRGMQAYEELEGPALAQVKADWLALRDIVLKCVREIAKWGLHKQIANRPLEAWMPCTQVISATSWSNMRALRCNPAAQPEFRDVMEKAFALYDASIPQQLGPGEWHLPYVTFCDEAELYEGWERIRGEREYLNVTRDTYMTYVSSGRCAAVSYLNQGERAPRQDFDRARNMLDNGHMSPFEHVAMAMTAGQWEAYARNAADLWVKDGYPVGNFHGFLQLRKTLDAEHDFSLRA
jgi:thymidylate synthase ThyX